MKLSVCVDALFRGIPFLEAMEQVSETGIKDIEFWSWSNKDIDAIKEKKDRLNLNVIALCARYISLVDPLKRAEYIEGLKQTIEVAQKLNCTRIICTVGDEMKGVSREEQHESLIKGLKQCAPYLSEAGITLLVEPLNTLVDHKGYYLNSSNEGFRIIDEVNDPYVKLLFDMYHQQIMEGNLIANITNNIDKIGHFHAAGNPGRHELDKGEINYNEIFAAIDNAGYEGFVGLEYFPLEHPTEGIKRLL